MNSLFWEAIHEKSHQSLPNPPEVSGSNDIRVRVYWWVWKRLETEKGVAGGLGEEARRQVYATSHLGQKNSPGWQFYEESKWFNKYTHPSLRIHWRFNMCISEHVD